MSQLNAQPGPARPRAGGQLPAVLAPDQDRMVRVSRDGCPSVAGLALAASGKSELRHVILVEGDQYYREMLTVELQRQGFAVNAFGNATALLGSLATVADADLVVLDWDLPQMPGTKLLAQLRQHGLDLPVVFLAGKVIAGSHHDKCLLASREALNAYEYMAFDHGAVDFIAKSRDKQVLVRRLRKVVELAKPKTKTDPRSAERLACGKLLLDDNRAYWDHVDVGLTLGEYNIVHLLASKAGSSATYRLVYDRLRYEGFVAGTGPQGYRANVRSAIKRIRNKFRACDPAFDQIDNFHGFGYCWRKPD
jgi:two-component system, OmpR family, response regulator ChvI